MPGPFTRKTIAEDLDRLGLPVGATVLVHSSLSKLGFVAGGAPAVVLAILDVIGPTGTLVVPTLSHQLSPAQRDYPPVPRGWVNTIVDEVPGFDPDLTPAKGMGAIAECVRDHPRARRSDHPTMSFAAVGANRDTIIDGHELSPALGESSPLGRLYDLDALVLLLGVDHAHNTSLHLAEHRSTYPNKKWDKAGAPVMVEGRREWRLWRDLVPDSRDFDFCGEQFAETGQERCGRVGAGVGLLMRQRAIVDFAAGWFSKFRADWSKVVDEDEFMAGHGTEDPTPDRVGLDPAVADSSKPRSCANTKR